MTGGMELRDKVAIVTGGAGGIGRALAWKFVEEGARGVLVADLAGTEAVAEQLGERAAGFDGDVTDEATVRALIARAEEAFGPVDLFCANAGVAVGIGLEEDEAVWDLAFGVNIRSHIYAAKALVPAWIERGSGYFLTTASAAGMLTQIGSAPYAVSKHAAVAFAEWLSVTYGDKGLHVSCLCPMGVNTNLLNAGIEAGELSTNVVAAAGAVLEADEVAERVLEALRDERFLVLPHPEVGEFLRRKATDPDRWLAGMRRLQAQVEGA
jgi:NAD(P)-dependent dehydrogenase (short-subunit alcohol dehydrogenase family)